MKAICYSISPQTTKDFSNLNQLPKCNTGVEQQQIYIYKCRTLNLPVFIPDLYYHSDLRNQNHATHPCIPIQEPILSISFFLSLPLPCNSYHQNSTNLLRSNQPNLNYCVTNHNPYCNTILTALHLTFGCIPELCTSIYNEISPVTHGEHSCR